MEIACVNVFSSVWFKEVPHQGFAGEHAGVADQVPRPWVVAGVDDEIAARQAIQSVLVCQGVLDGRAPAERTERCSMQSEICCREKAWGSGRLAKHQMAYIPLSFSRRVKIRFSAQHERFRGAGEPATRFMYKLIQAAQANLNSDLSSKRQNTSTTPL